MNAKIPSQVELLEQGLNPKTIRVDISRGKIMLVADWLNGGGRAALKDAPEEIHSNAPLVNIQRARRWAEEIGVPCEV